MDSGQWIVEGGEAQGFGLGAGWVDCSAGSVSPAALCVAVLGGRCCSRSPVGRCVRLIASCLASTVARENCELSATSRAAVGVGAGRAEFGRGAARGCGADMVGGDDVEADPVVQWGRFEVGGLGRAGVVGGDVDWCGGGLRRIKARVSGGAAIRSVAWCWVLGIGGLVWRARNSPGIRGELLALFRGFLPTLGGGEEGHDASVLAQWRVHCVPVRPELYEHRPGARTAAGRGLEGN